MRPTTGASRRSLNRIAPPCDATPAPSAARSEDAARLRARVRARPDLRAERPRECLTPKTGGSPERQPDLAVPDHAVHRGGGVRDRRGRAALLATGSAPRRAAMAAQIHGNTRLEIGWTVAAARDPRGARRRHVRQAAEILNPPNSGPGRPRPQRLTVRLRPARQAAQRREAHDLQVKGQQYIWRYGYLELLAEPPTSWNALLLPADGRADEHDGRAQGRPRTT